MEKRNDLIALLKEMKHTNITYKQIAETLNIKVNTLYSWIQKGNISEKKAAYILKQIERHFPEEYLYIMVSIGLREVENEIREALERGNDVC